MPFSPVQTMAGHNRLNVHVANDVWVLNAFFADRAFSQAGE
jgi:hypothetical protein